MLSITSKITLSDEETESNQSEDGLNNYLPPFGRTNFFETGYKIHNGRFKAVKSINHLQQAMNNNSGKDSLKKIDETRLAQTRQ